MANNMYPPNEIDKIIKEQITGDCFDKFPHKWEQDYLQAYMVGKTGTPSSPNVGEGISVRDLLQRGDQPVPDQYRCKRCHTVGKYQDLPADKTYEPIIVRIR